MIAQNKNLCINLLFSISIFLIGVSCQSQKTSLKQPSAGDIAKLGQKIDSTLMAKMEDEHIPGVAVIVVQDGKTIFKNAYGVANTETNQPVDVDSTIFRIGSTSKALTFFVLTKLIDQGLVGYEDPVSNYLEGITNPYNYQDTIRIKHILTHTGGFDQVGYGRQILDFELPLEERKAKRPDILEFLQQNNMRRIRSAGQHFTYDTYGTTVAGAIIEKVTGLPYEKAMQKELFQPLGMRSSNVEVEPSNISRLVKGHGYNNGRYETMPYEVYLTPPASSIDATASDMGLLLHALTTNGSNEYGQLFTEKMLQKVISPQFRPHPEFVGMTHGLWESARIGSIPNAYQIRTVGHGGDMLGITCAMELIPELGIGFFVAANRNGEAGGGSVSIGRPVMNVVLDHFGMKREAPYFPIPEAKLDIDLDEYTGDYVFGIYCHTCSQEEFAQGAWRRGNTIPIKAKGGKLMLRDDVYIACEKDIFVREDGQEMIFFGRNEKKEVAYFVYSDNSHSYERIGEE